MITRPTSGSGHPSNPEVPPHFVPKLLLKRDPPLIECRRLLEQITGGDWANAERALAAAPPIPLCQAWLAQPEPQFRSATVRTGWWDETLWVLAEIHDVDIFNPVVEFNADFFLSGDVFEIFLRPDPQDAYYEFHIGPANQKFQVRIPSGAAFRQPPPHGRRDWKVVTPLLQSWTRVDVARQRWQVMAAVPFAAVCESPAALAGREWWFSFCRYDYTRGGGTPCLSSTSPHRRVDFHRQEEWRRLRFIP